MYKRTPIYKLELGRGTQPIVLSHTTAGKTSMHDREYTLRLSSAQALELARDLIEFAQGQLAKDHESHKRFVRYHRDEIKRLNDRVRSRS